MLITRDPRETNRTNYIRFTYYTLLPRKTVPELVQSEMLQSIFWRDILHMTGKCGSVELAFGWPQMVKYLFSTKKCITSFMTFIGIFRNYDSLTQIPFCI